MALKTDRPKAEWIKFRVEPALKDAWRGWLGGQNESQVFRDVMRKLMGKEPAKVMPKAEIMTEDPDYGVRTNTMKLTFKKSEIKKIEQAADLALMGRNEWAVACIRAQLTRAPHLGGAELEALRESNRELTAIGRNLNQMARKLNTSLDNAHLIQAQEIERVAKEVKRHAAVMTAVIDMNLERWGIK